MDPHPNGSGIVDATPPSIAIAFDPIAQDCALTVNPAQVKNWNFAIALLDLAKQKAELMVKLAQAQMIQEAQQEAMQTQALRRNLGY